MKIKKVFLKLFGHNKILKIQEQLTEIKESLVHIQRIQNELLYANKFHDTAIEYAWLKNKDLSLGGATVDYAFCYTLARVLNYMKPSSILECGLGQSSKIIHQYAHFYGKKAITCEHDMKWGKFFLNELNNKYPINIEYFDLESKNINGFPSLTYKDITNRFKNDIFDLIIIDGPYGSPHYSRSQVIDLTTNNLSDHFCIIIDDYERTGEKETWEIVKERLQKRGIKFYDTIYSARQDHALICSEDLIFLTWL